MKLTVNFLGGKKTLVVHYDGISLEQLQEGKTSVKKRISVVVTSPNLQSDQVLGVPITASNSGKDQRDVVLKVIEEWDIGEYIFGLAFDTTSDNTGKNKGSVVLLEKSLGSAVLWLPCPHHFYELHPKKVARLCFGDTSSPEESLFKRLKENWNDILEEKINYDNLDKFDWEKWENTHLAE